MGSSMKIDRLSLRLSGLSAEEGQRLAQLIAERLGTGGAGTESRPDVTGSRLDGRKRARIDRLQVRATAQPGGDMDRLAAQIAEQVLRELGRSL
jgi:hypothetical protein